MKVSLKIQERSLSQVNLALEENPRKNVYFQKTTEKQILQLLSPQKPDSIIAAKTMDYISANNGFIH